MKISCRFSSAGSRRQTYDQRIVESSICRSHCNQQKINRKTHPTTISDISHHNFPLPLFSLPFHSHSTAQWQVQNCLSLVYFSFTSSLISPPSLLSHAFATQFNFSIPLTFLFYQILLPAGTLFTHRKNKYRWKTFSKTFGFHFAYDERSYTASTVLPFL